MGDRLFSGRLDHARGVLVRCIGRKGVYAGTSRYRYQCWTRDFVLAGLDALLDLGLGEHARKNLEEIARRQGRDGQIPVMYVANYVGAALLHARDALRDPVRMLKQARLYLKTAGIKRGFSFSNLTPWTADCEPLFIIGCYRYAERTGDEAFLARMRPHILRAFRYIEHYATKDGFLVGSDWRDVMTDLKDAVLLSNNALLAAAYMAAGEPQIARDLKRRIEKHFWTGAYYRDRLGSDEFDTFGQSLAVLCGVVPDEHIPSILRQYEFLERGIGFAANNLPSGNTDPAVQHYVDQYGTMWPFVHGFAILALEAMGEREWAVKEFAAWSALPDFCEWYDPKQGGSCSGEHEQMWSAALYLRAHRTLFPGSFLSAKESSALAPVFFFPHASLNKDFTK